VYRQCTEIKAPATLLSRQSITTGNMTITDKQEFAMQGQYEMTSPTNASADCSSQAPYSDHIEATQIMCFNVYIN
jgi:hypothetical protein